jgi:hypothetical protein
MTVPTDDDVSAFVDAIADERRRADARTLVALMSEVTGQPPRMWGGSIVGFGTYHYVYESGREGDWAAVGFSPRKASTTVYVMAGFDGYRELLERLGPHTTGKSCLYLRRLDAVDLEVLREMVRRSYAYITTRSWP